MTSLFSHAESPLDPPDMSPGDPGLFGPDSVSWQVIGHPSAFVGGIRALLVQSAHPEVLAGVVDHSRYRQDPLGRLSRTANWVTATTFGSGPDIERAVAAVRHAHRPVHGSSARGVAYSANDPALAAFVHNALTESFLTTYEWFGPGLSRSDGDRFVAEQQQVAALLGVHDCPTGVDALRDWLYQHPNIERSVDLPATQAFLRRPPLAPPTLLGYALLYQGAVASIPASMRELLGVTPKPGAAAVARPVVAALGAALGESPSRQLALQRTTLGDD